MTRNELYNKITPCGTLPYPSMVYLIKNVEFAHSGIRELLLKRILHTGQLKQSDWLVFLRNVHYTYNSPIDSEIAESWLIGKCNLTKRELVTLLNYVLFLDGSEPTYVVTELEYLIVPEEA